MTEANAMKVANSYVLKERGISAIPVEVRLVSQGPENFWWASYGTAVLFPEATAAGATVDGGEYILRVDDSTGRVKVLS